MTIRTALLNWNNITRDTDFSKYIESVSEPWVIDWLEVTSTKVWIWKAWVLCERTNGDTIYALVYNTSEVTISWNGDVYIQVSQTYIDDGELANEDWTWIATISVGTMPSKNALKLATITSGVVEDKRNIIKRVGELSRSIVNLDTRVDAIEDIAGKSRLVKDVIVWERYTSSDDVFIQYAPKFENSKMGLPVWDVNWRTQIHIQRASSTVESNQLKLKMRKVGSPTSKVVVEIKKGAVVNDTNEDYWYGPWDTIATAEIAYTSFTTSWQELTFTFDNNFWGGETKELLSVIVRQESDIVNASNYYELACDITQYSEGLRAVFVEDSSTRTTSKVMPYCDSDAFEKCILARKDDTLYSMPYKFPVLENMSVTGSTGNDWVKFTMTSHATSVEVVWHVTNTQSGTTPSRYWVVKINNWNTAEVLYSQSWWYDADIDQTLSIWENDSLSFWATSTYNNFYWNFENIYVYALNWKINKSQSGALAKVSEVFSVWEPISALTFWDTWDEYFIWWLAYEWDKINLNYSATSTNNWYCWFIAPADWIAITDIWDNEINGLYFKGISLPRNSEIPIKKGDLIYCYKSSNNTDWTNQYRVNFKFIFMIKS